MALAETRTTLKTIVPVSPRVVAWLMTTAIAVPVVMSDLTQANAQSTTTQLPAVTVEQPSSAPRAVRPKRVSNRSTSGRPQTQSQQRIPQSAAPVVSAAFVRGTDPVRGFVPNLSSVGTKTDTPLIETPQSVSVISRENLDARGVETIVEALQYTAGVSPQTGGKDPRYDNAKIRGFETYGNGQFRDGLRDIANPNNFGLFRNEPYGVQRVDVVKGSSSVLYGQNGPGGLIDLISKRPQAQAFGEIQGLIGNFDRFQGAFDLGGPVDKDGKLLYRLTGVFRESDAQIAAFSSDVKDNRVYIAPAVTWQPNANTTMTILSDYHHDITGNAFPLSIATLTGGRITGITALPLMLGDPSFNKFDQEQYRIGYQFEHRFSDDLIVRSKARFGHLDVDYRYLTFAGNPLSTLTSYPRVARQVYESTNSFSTDNHVIAKAWTGPLLHTVLFGTDYQLFGLDTSTLGGVGPAISRITPVYGQFVTPPTSPIQSTDQDMNQVGVYLQDQIKLQNWILTLGGRFDRVEQNTLDRLTGRPQKSADEAGTKRFGLTYVFENGIAPYVSYSESFLPTPGVDFNAVAFKPTSSKQYEGGIKFQPNRDVLVTMAYFDLTQKNVLGPDPVAGRIGYNVQTGEVNSQGFEFEALVKFLPGLNVIGTYTVNDIKITESTNGDVGKVPLLAPRTMASAFADYTFQSGVLEGFGFGAGVRYNGETYADPLNTIVNPEYTVFDAGLHYRREKGMNYALNLKNIGNNGALACTTSGGCQYISPRIVTATASYRW
ncbi:TonB-dependent siderophore receptor [Tardiphaga sp. 604_B6_N1_1]|uniref:TonB-dependent siderophore receptor n=1 Tax=unclassified Tardiphaga TaxID=2631404 RepID=UPI000FF3CD2E